MAEPRTVANRGAAGLTGDTADARGEAQGREPERQRVEGLITQIVALTGIDAAGVQLVLAGLLDLAGQALGAEDAALLFGMIPGASEVAAHGLLGGSGVALDALLGRPVDGSVAMMDLVRDSGLAPDQVATIADMLLGYVEQTAGGEAANRLYGALPGLASLG